MKYFGVVCTLILAFVVSLERRVVNAHCCSSFNGSFVDSCVCSDGNDQNPAPLNSTDCHPGRSSLTADTFFTTCPCSVRVRATWACERTNPETLLRIPVEARLQSDPPGGGPACDNNENVNSICWGSCDPIVQHLCRGTNWSANGIVDSGLTDSCPPFPGLRVYILLRGDLTPCAVGSTCTGCRVLRRIDVKCEPLHTPPCP
jgi:hypothetical protein